MVERVPVPRDRENDYTHDAARARALFAQERTGASLDHVSSYSFDPSRARQVSNLGGFMSGVNNNGELSLGSAIVAEEWVKAHDIFGRNR
jgi:hypothetical protein